MQLKKEISVGNIISITSSLIMIIYMYASLHFQVDNHEKRITSNEESIKEMSHSITVLATLAAVQDKTIPQTINIK
jgi:hypothetical protein